MFYVFHTGRDDVGNMKGVTYSFVEFQPNEQTGCIPCLLSFFYTESKISTEGRLSQIIVEYILKTDDGNIWLSEVTLKKRAYC